jgi:uncharacterized membrane protein
MSAKVIATVALISLVSGIVTYFVTRELEYRYPRVNAEERG